MKNVNHDLRLKMLIADVSMRKQKELYFMSSFITKIS